MPADPNYHEPTDTSLCWRFRVSGKVQGVYFRASTRAEALQLGLTGLARNEVDGTVTVFACGEANALSALHEWLKQGPAAARVDDVKVEVVSGPSFTGFSTA